MVLERMIGKLIHKPLRVLGCDEIDESVAYVGPVLSIHGEVKEVIAAPESGLVDLLKKESL